MTNNKDIIIDTLLAAGWQKTDKVNGIPIRYRKTSSSYWLRFSYEGPGMNDCEYTPETGWECYGYY